MKGKPLSSCFSSIRIEVNRIWPHTVILSKSFSTYLLVSTQASIDESKTTDEVLTRLISAIENDPVSIKETCSAYIENLCRSGNISDVGRLLRNLHDKQVFLNPKAYTMLLTVVGNEKNFEILPQIFKDVLLSRDFLGPGFYSSLAKAFSNLTDSVPLVKFINEVSDMVFPNGTIVMNKIIVGFAESKQIDKALMIFDRMKGLNCKPDLITFNIVLDILGRAGLLDETLRVFTSMKQSGFIPDIISYNTLINNFRKFGRLDLCLVYLREMIEREVDPDLQTYYALIDSFGRSGRVEEALRLFGQMKKRGIHPSIYVYRSLVSNLKKAGKLKLAISLLEERNSLGHDFQIPKHFEENR